MSNIHISSKFHGDSMPVSVSKGVAIYITPHHSSSQFIYNIAIPKRCSGIYSLPKNLAQKCNIPPYSINHLHSSLSSSVIGPFFANRPTSFLTAHISAAMPASRINRMMSIIAIATFCWTILVGDQRSGVDV